MKKRSDSRVSKYELYELAVQSPKMHIDLVEAIDRDIRREPARRLREDFCGTFLLSCEWVKRHPKNEAYCLDLDAEPISHGKSVHLKQLTANQKKRVKTEIGDVRTPRPGRSDLIIVGNFSFFIFKERKTLKDYFKSCFKSLETQGLVILEMAGGPGMITQSREQRSFRTESGAKFTYFWDQRSFDPISHEAKYAIHFKSSEGAWMKNAFTYDWRLWTIPEIRETLLEAGFRKTFVYWEAEHRGKGTGEFVKTEKADNAFAWIAYVVGMR